MNVVKPMLAKDGDLSKITYPVIVQPKLDGIRCLIVDGVARSRTFKPIPNAEIQATLGRPEYNGLDGELIVGEPTAEGCMQRTTSFVMAEDKTGADWTFRVFDCWSTQGDFIKRYADAKAIYYAGGGGQTRLRLVDGHEVTNATELEYFESLLVGNGHEGIIVRDPNAPYKHGRSGVKGPLLKVKRFIDFEAEILGVYEEMENTNEAKRDAFGRTERSTMKAGKVGKGRLGGFELRAINGPAEGVTFRCGTGFNAEQREEFWAMQDIIIPNAVGERPGMIVKIKSFPIGVKDKPRFPVFLGFRDMEVDG